MTIGLLVPASAEERDDVVAVLDFEDARLRCRKPSLGSHGYAQMVRDLGRLAATSQSRRIVVSGSDSMA
jgi:hypothetical protein